MGYAGFMLRELCDFPVIEPDRMREQGLRAQHYDSLQLRDTAVAKTPAALVTRIIRRRCAQQLSASAVDRPLLHRTFMKNVGTVVETLTFN